MEEERGRKGLDKLTARGRSDSVGSMDSTKRRGSIDELWKRKREELERSGGEEAEIFKKSKIVIRSPRKEETEEGRRIEEWMKEVGGTGRNERGN